MYNYREEMKNDIINYIKDNDVLDYDYLDLDELREILGDELWDKDEITGNGSYGYHTPAQCEKYLCDGNIKLLLEALSYFDWDLDNLKSNDYDVLMRQCDSIIRCYLLPEAIYAALDELGLKEEK